MTSVFRDKLFHVIRCGMEIEETSLNLTEEDCQDLMDFGSKQSIQPIVYHGLKRMEVPKAYLSQFDNVYYKSIQRTLQRDTSLQEITNALKEGKITYVPLKGSVLRDLYPNPNLRTSSDIDILVHKDDLDQAVKELETKAGFEFLKRGYHDISLKNTSIHLELHFSIKEHFENLDKLLSKAWDYTVQTGDPFRYAFTTEYQMFHVIAHMSYHFLHGGLGIRPFLDLWLLKHKTEYEEKTVRQMCDDCGILKFYEECCELSEIWMGTKEYTETAKMLEKACLSGGVFGSKDFKNAVRQREHRGIVYIMSRIFPPAYQVREFYKSENGKKHTLPYYYVKRWTSWLGKDRREELTDQVHSLMSSDSDYLDFTENLIGVLELQSME